MVDIDAVLIEGVYQIIVHLQIAIGAEEGYRQAVACTEDNMRKVGLCAILENGAVRRVALHNRLLHNIRHKIGDWRLLLEMMT